MSSLSDHAPREHSDLKTTIRKGLVMVHTGSGKGKSTAAFGTALRAMGHGKKVAIVQFIKGGWIPGEVRFFQRHSGLCQIHPMGEGFTWKTKDYARDVAVARRAWERCLTFLRDQEHFLVIFDEINYALKYQFLDVREVIEALNDKPPEKHVILTGNGAPDALIEVADLVTEMRCLKHPYQQGIKAQPGIDY